MGGDPDVPSPPRALPGGTARRLAMRIKILSEPVRLRLLSLVVAAGAVGVNAGTLAGQVDVVGPTVSHHLRVLTEAGLVRSSRERSRIVYAATPTGARLYRQLQRLGGDAAPPSTADGATLRELLDDLADTPVTGGRAVPPAAGSPLPGLLDPDELLDRVRDRLAVRFAGVFSAETVHRYLADSYERLAHSAVVTSHLPVLTEQFAAERLAAMARSRGLLAKPVPDVLFVCVHNSGRSQMAAGLLRHLAGDRVQIRSAGSEPTVGIDPGVHAVMAEIGIDLRAEYPKPLTDEAIRAADVVITMGCGDACPVYPGKRYLDWKVSEPARRPLSGIRRIRDDIDARIRTVLLPELLGDPPAAPG
ncbi:protein-tyrosine-phosphatase [Allonocardiopsis opalescens]|uniref:Protein-tyrosine-phosphatase n=2 Tax=Allonocardiopsis opalescens TaxID=1144618 RepID=A0A2T0Q5F2_9ACTN|nr:protein-tyrosine-phosphatase [Allonocardiopsis opalescens]